MQVVGNNALKEKKPQCYHCGEICIDEVIENDGRQFCCQGCQTVYELLNENELCDYYSISERPGIKVREKRPGLRYAFLDVDEIKNDLLVFADGKMEKVRLTIPAVHCSSCIWLLENLHQLHEGILHASINFLRKQVTITYNNQQITLREVAELLYSLGYAPDISLDSTQSNKGNYRTNNSVAIKLGVAGFCFGNIMLLSFPEYFSSGTYFDFSHNRFFAYLNIALATPVLLFSSIDYFISAYKGLRGKMINIDVPVSLGIFVLFIRSLYDILSGTGPGYLDSFAGLVFFLLIGKWFQQKTYQALSFEKDYKAYFPAAITRIEGKKEVIVPLNSIKKGDLLLIRNNELIPCDSQLREDTANIDYSFVTGESLPVTKKKNDVLFAGGRAINDSFHVKATKEVSGSYLVELWKQDAFENTEQHSTASMINNISKYFTFVILAIATVAGLYWWTVEPQKIWTVVTAVLIVACPCALALSVPFTYGNTLRVFGKQGLFMKDAQAVEQLAGIDTIVFDKTGTITDHHAVELIFTGKSLSIDDQNAIYSLCKHSFHPLSQSIVSKLGSCETVPVEQFSEITGKGIEGNVNHAVYKIGSSQWVLSEDQHDQADSVYISRNGKVLGSYRIINSYRPQLAGLFRKLVNRYRLAILSGDNDRERNRLKSLLPAGTDLYFRQSPYDKLNFIKNQQEQQHRVIMVGDGLNDAGALKQSDFGISVAENVHHFSPSCDAILDAGHFENIPFYLKFSRTAVRVVTASIVISFLYNLVGLTLAVKGLLSPLIAAILMPLSSITVVSFITLTINILYKSTRQRVSQLK